MPERCPIHGIEHPAPGDFATVTTAPLCPRCSPEGVAIAVASVDPLVAQAIRKQREQELRQRLNGVNQALDMSAELDEETSELVISTLERFFESIFEDPS